MFSSQRLLSQLPQLRQSLHTTSTKIAYGRSRCSFSTVLSDDAEFDKSKKDVCKKVLVSNSVLSFVANATNELYPMLSML